VVQDIGQVRHIEAVQNGFSVAVELTGLSDSDIDELICAANLASVKANAKSRHARATDNVEQQVRQAASL